MKKAYLLLFFFICTTAHAEPSDIIDFLSEIPCVIGGSTIIHDQTDCERLREPHRFYEVCPPWDKDCYTEEVSDALVGCHAIAQNSLFISKDTSFYSCFTRRARTEAVASYRTVCAYDKTAQHIPVEELSGTARAAIHSACDKIGYR